MRKGIWGIAIALLAAGACHGECRNVAEWQMDACRRACAPGAVARVTPDECVCQRAGAPDAGAEAGAPE